MMLKMLTVMACIVAVVAQILIFQWDYCINITDYFSIYNAPTARGEPTLGYGVPYGSRKEIVRGVTHYVVLSPTIVGVKTSEAFLIAKADGTVSRCSSEEAWRKTCGTLLPQDQMDDRLVSRFSDPTIAVMQSSLFVLVVLFGAGVVVSRRATLKRGGP